MAKASAPSELADPKKARFSMGIWGSILAFVPFIDFAVGVVSDAVSVVPLELISPQAAAVVGGIGAVVAFWGRFRAKHKIEGL